IPGSERDAAAPDDFTVGTTGSHGHDRVCGRFFGYSDTDLVGVGAVLTIVTQQRPFRMIFKTDADESTIGDMEDLVDTNELAKFPGGIIGFHLNYALQRLLINFGNVKTSNSTLVRIFFIMIFILLYITFIFLSKNVDHVFSKIR
ncbi:hypothetical protein TCAL_08661, partial [Tigriopus californicus]